MSPARSDDLGDWPSLPPGASLADRLQGKRVMIDFFEGNREAEVLCDELQRTLGVTCVQVIYGKGASTLREAGMDPFKMRDAWFEDISWGTWQDLHTRGLERFGVDISLIAVGSGQGPAGLFVWQGDYEILIYDERRPAKLLAYVEASGRAGGMGEKAKLDADRRAVRNLVRKLERMPASWEIATGYPGKASYPYPLPPIPVSVEVLLRMPGLRMRADAGGWQKGHSLQPMWRESERSFRVDVVNVFKKVNSHLSRASVEAYPIEDVLAPDEIEAAERSRWDPGPKLMQMANADKLKHAKLSWYKEYTAYSHSARWLEFKRFDKYLPGTAAGWACPESRRFFWMPGVVEDFPADWLIAHFKDKTTVDHALSPAPLPPEVPAPLPVRGETWAYFKGPIPQEGPRRAPDYMLRLVEGGSQPEVIASEPLDETGEQGYRWFEVPYPLKDLEFPLSPGKTWTTPGGEKATVKAGVVLQPENLAAVPITFEKQGKVTRTLYYAPEVNAIAREVDGTGKVVRSLWLSAVRYVAPEREKAKNTSN